jgi:hypothetical protein
MVTVTLTPELLLTICWPISCASNAVVVSGPGIRKETPKLAISLITVITSLHAPSAMDTCSDSMTRGAASERERRVSVANVTHRALLLLLLLGMYCRLRGSVCCAGSTGVVSVARGIIKET